MKIIFKLTRGGADGKLKLIRSEKNSGGCPGVPRNLGIGLSIGEYLMFVDSDDAITPNALEELYTIAKKFNADVVHAEKYFRVENEKFSTDTRTLKADAIIKADFVKEPTFMPNDLSSRLKYLANEKFDWSTCNNFLRRDTVIRKKIYFSTVNQSFEDAVLAAKYLCRAEKILRVPITFYLYRTHSESTTKKNLPVDKRIHRVITNIAFLIKELDKIFNEFENIKNNPDKFILFDMLIRRAVKSILPLYMLIPAWQLDNLIRHELESVEDKTALTAFLFSRMNIFNVQLNQYGAIIQQQNQVIQQLQAQIQK